MKNVFLKDMVKQVNATKLNLLAKCVGLWLLGG